MCCQLHLLINNFINREPSVERSLEYNWFGWDNESTNELFRLFHNDLIKAIENNVQQNNTYRLKNCITRILKWGGITTPGALSERYAKMITNVWSFSPPEQPSEIDYNRIIGEEDETPLSSWTKILAAYNPEAFCIYDARTGVALRYLTEENWYLPHYTRTYNKAIKKIIRFYNGTSKTPNQLSHRESYKKYMKFLEETHDPVGYERKLFMLGGLLQFNDSQNTVIVTR